MKEYSADRGVEFVPITREKDKREHNMEALGKEALPLARGLQKGFGFAVFPGGSVQPGRSDGYGGIHGMQEIEDADLIDLYQFVERFGRQGRDEAFFQPVGIENTHKLFSPDSRFPTVEGLIGLYAAKSLLEELGLSLVPINVNVGMPVARDDLVSALGTNWINDPKAVNHFLMGYSALLVPPSARGVYKAA